MTENEAAKLTLDAAFEIHRKLGPGLLESAYQICLFHELHSKGIQVRREVKQPIYFKDIKIDQGYRIDILVEDKLVVELKTVEALHEVHTAQILTYMKLGGYKLGLLLNFHEKWLKRGIKRVIL